MTGLNKKQHLAQRIQEAEQKIQKKEEKLIVPKKHFEGMRLATLADFPFVERNNELAFSFVYENPETKTKIIGEASKQVLKDLDLTNEDLTYYDKRFVFSINNWLMDKRARLGTTEIEGDIKSLTKAILSHSSKKQRPRPKDYKKTRVGLQLLASIQYVIKTKTTKGVVNTGNSLKLYSTTDRFVYYLNKSVPLVVEDTIAEPSKKPLAPYVSLSEKDYYPKQGTYAFALKHYLVGIKNTKQDIPSIKGITILDHSGYLADVKLKGKKYRKKEAKKIIDKFIALGKEYGLRIGCHKKSDKVKDVRQRYYYIKPPYHRQEKQSIPDEVKKALIDEVAVIINREPQYSNMDISRNKAKGLFTKYGPKHLKEMSDKGQREHKDAFNGSILKEMLVKKTGY